MTKFAENLTRDEAVFMLVAANYSKRDAGKLCTEARKLAFVITSNVEISTDRLNRYTVKVK